MAFLVGGCSFAFVRVPDVRPAGEQLECLDAIVLPSLDAAAAAGFGYGIIESGSVTQAYGAGFVLVALAATELASTIYGYRAYARCRRLNRP